MRLRFLGTGTSTGNPEIGCTCEVCTSKDKKDTRFRSSSLLEINDKQILIDCGPDFRMQMLEAIPSFSYKELSGVILTHEHYDHVGGLDDLRAYCRFGAAVNVYAEQCVIEAIQTRMPYVFKENKYPGVPNLVMNEVKPDQPFCIEGIEIQPIRLMHGQLPILGYRIGNLAYLTDLKTIPEQEYTKLQNLDVLIINALRAKDHLSHENIEEALENIEKIKPSKAYFIHMTHTFGLHEEMQKTLPENVFIAYDGLEIYV
ncbi:phosphoribosyl 1,2-cyclic phosphate phosphodiesterase [Dysgonomonadaceae bacterium PH5-43]|nr:phosphoribosyl 1,2-cyclic phosphate phosphodiesterase [Dysgonomonadaceae bacterium PH5-43]